MGNISECKCKCRDGKQEVEVNFPSFKTNLKETQNETNENNNISKNIEIEVKDKNIEQTNEDKEKESKIKKENLDDYFEGISEVKLNEIEYSNNDISKSKVEKDEKKNQFNEDTSFKVKNNSANSSMYNSSKRLDYDSFCLDKNKSFKRQTTFLNSSKNMKQENQKTNFFNQKTKTTNADYLKNKFLSKKNMTKKSNNSINEKDSSYFSQLSQFNTSQCKDFLEKYHLNCTQATTKIPISKIINHINLMNNDTDDVLFHSDLNRVQFSGERIISKKYISRFFSSTKRELRIYSSKEKFITLQTPIQIFYYYNMKKTCMVEFDFIKKTDNFDVKNRKDLVHFMIYFDNESFEVFSGENEVVEKWVTLINYLIENQNDIYVVDN